jgi:hypothetical protein
VTTTGPYGSVRFGWSTSNSEDLQWAIPASIRFHNLAVNIHSTGLNWLPWHTDRWVVGSFHHVSVVVDRLLWLVFPVPNVAWMVSVVASIIILAKKFGGAGPSFLPSCCRRRATRRPSIGAPPQKIWRVVCGGCIRWSKPQQENAATRQRPTTTKARIALYRHGL